jgi:hypothetical protein
MLGALFLFKVLAGAAGAALIRQTKRQAVLVQGHCLWPNCAFP